MKKELHPSCPDVRVLEDVAAGVCAPELERQTIQHVAQCESCGPRFRGLLRIESKAPMSEAEAAIFKQLKTSSPDMQRNWLAKQGLMANATASGQRKAAKNIPQMVADPTHHEIKWLPRLAYTAAGIAAVVAGFAWIPGILAGMELSRADNLVKAAFVEKRTIESRFSGAPAADFRPNPVTLGSNDAASDFERPELAKAQGLVADKVKTGDPRWLQQQGRISLLRGDARGLSDAEKMFETASRKDPDSASLKIDLAVTYYERDSKDEHPNLQKSLDMLLEVLHRNNLNNEDRATALFDLALAYEKTQAWDLAVDTWQKYLDVDKSGPWVEQVKQHLKDAQGKLPASKPKTYNQPSFFLQNVAKMSAEDAEEYQSVALNEWLPAAMQKQDKEVQQAMDALAEVLYKQHSDPWLKDFLAATNGGNAAAVEALTAALKANGAGDYKQGLSQAIQATQWFSQKKNSAGALRSQLEEVYARRRALQGVDCNQLADALGDKLASTKYRWLQARVALERSECSNLRGEFTESDKNLKASRELAEEFDFPVLLLQDIGISAGIKHLRGQCDDSWKESVAGLEKYWHGKYVRGERLYQFYAVMAQCSIDHATTYASEALIRQVLRPESETGIKKKRLAEGIVHLHMANILEARSSMKESQAEMRAAKSMLPKDGPGADYEFTGKIETAEIELKQGSPELALAKLASIPLRTDDSYFTLNLARVLGATYFRLGRLDEAESAYQRGIASAENSLAGLKGIEQRMQWLRTTDQSYRGLVRVLIAKKQDRQALETWEWYRSRSLAQRLFETTIPAGSAISGVESKPSALPTISQTRLVYAGFADGVQIWVVNSKGVASRWVDVGEESLTHLTEEFSEECSRRDSSINQIRSHGQALYSLLLEPIVSGLSDDEPIILEMDRFAYGLPMQALVRPSGQYFGQEHPIVYSPGLWMELSLRNPKELGPQDRVLLVDATRASQTKVSEMDSERHTIVQEFPRTHAVNSERMRAADLVPLLSASDVFHYMGHGRIDGDGSVLVLNDRESLKTTDLSGRTLSHLQLGVLAACSTGLGKKDGILDSNNLVRSFLSAGVPRIVASRWDVDAISTDRLMNEFYLSLSQRRSATEAMFDARKKTSNENPHPYYWAAFDLVGRAL